MAVYINAGHAPPDGGRPWKHIDGRCPHLQALADEGFPVQRVRNVDAQKPLSEHVRRRCECFRLQVELRPKPPRFLQRAATLEKSSPHGSWWTYNLYDSESKSSQVGMAANLTQRLDSRWRASCRAGFPPDGIPWLNSRLAADASFEPVLEVARFASREEALTAEELLRRSLRDVGWVVSSDV